jgi:HAD superfamily hydrolase (TIGR01509 family)
MDGTIIDSMWVWSEIDFKYLKDRNIEVPKDLKDAIEHMSFIEVAEYFKNRFKLSDTIEEIMDEWNKMAYEQYKNNVPLKPGAKDYLLKLKTSGIKLALATSNCNLLLETVLKKHGIFHLFDVITTTDEVSRGKDFPDVFLLAAKKLDIKPENCVVFEDILPAVKGAKSAGMKVIGVYDTYSEHQKDCIIKTADKFILGYDELNEAV